MSALANRGRILALEQIIREQPERLEAGDFVTRHYFADGIYAREIEIPAGVALIGKIHRTRHLNVVSRGHIVVFTEDGGQREIVAPCTFVAEAGTKRAGFALEDTVWTTVHATRETDLDKLEAELIAPSFEALEHDKGEQQCLG